MNSQPFPTQKIFGIDIASLSLVDIPLIVISLIDSSGKKTLFYINAHCLNLANEDKEYRTILQEASLVYSGGIGPVLASNFLNKSLKERTPTPDFIFDVLSVGQEKGWSVYLLGSERGIVQKVAVVMEKKLPKLKIVGCHHGYFDKSQDQEVIAEINRLKPTIILVGMGTPKQEKWIAQNKEKINVKAFWSVGMMFDVLTGDMPRAPKFMQLMYSEWLFRLFQEPGRLWKRYLFGNIKFMLLIFKELLNPSK